MRTASPCTCACTFNHKWLVRVSRGIEPYNIIFPVKVEEIVLFIDMLKAYRSFSILVRGNKFQFAVFSCSCIVKLFKMGFVFFQLNIEIGHGTFHA